MQNTRPMYFPADRFLRLLMLLSFFFPVLLQLSLVDDNRMGKPVTLLVKKYSKHQHEIYVARSPSATFLPVAASRTAATSAAGEETDRF